MLLGIPITKYRNNNILIILTVELFNTINVKIGIFGK